KYPTAKAYLEDVIARKIKDPTISFQINNGFEPVMILEDYLPNDMESLGLAVLMKWENPNVDKYEDRLAPYRIDESENVRICTINYEQRALKSLDEFKSIMEYFLGVAADYNCDFILFPEFVTMP